MALRCITTLSKTPGICRTNELSASAKQYLYLHPLALVLIPKRAKIGQSDLNDLRIETLLFRACGREFTCLSSTSTKVPEIVDRFNELLHINRLNEKHRPHAAHSCHIFLSPFYNHRFPVIYSFPSTMFLALIPVNQNPNSPCSAITSVSLIT